MTRLQTVAGFTIGAMAFALGIAFTIKVIDWIIDGSWPAFLLASAIIFVGLYVSDVVTDGRVTS